MALLLGIDISTTASKALLIDESGAVVASASSGHTISSPHPQWSEQDPREWWNAIRKSILKVLDARGVESRAIAGIGLSGQMHGLVLLDSERQVLRPAILWNDQRSAAECDEIRQRIGLERLIEITGNDAFAGFSAPKLLWVQNNEPETFARISHVLLPKDYIRLMLTDEFATDKAGAGGTLMLDLTTRDWSTEVLDAFGWDHDWMAPTFEGSAVTGHVSVEAAEATGLHAGTPVMGGGGDQAAQAVGVGAVSPDIWGVTLGTSGVVFAPSEMAVTDSKGRVHAFPHAVASQWHLMGVMLSASGSLAWYRDTLAPSTSYEDLLGEAEEAPPGCDGLFFMPYLTGERTPYADSELRGAFVGLTARHSRGHMTRAVLEGVAFGLRDNLLLLTEMGLPEPRIVRLSGGGTQSDLWKQILADTLGLNLETVEVREGAAFGAALLAGVGAGFWPTTESACQSAVRIDGVITFSPEMHAEYASFHARFRALYPILSPFYRH